MLVKELIAELTKRDPEARVLVDGYEYGLADPMLRNARAALNVCAPTPGGPHADFAEDGWLIEDAVEDGKVVEVVAAVVVSRRAP